VPPPTARSELYGQVLDELRSIAAARGADGAVVSAAKGASKVLKYLNAYDRYGATLEGAELDALAGLLVDRPTDLASGRTRLADALARGGIGFERALDFFALQTAGDALLAADASGGIAGRGYPPLRITEPQ
jgi:hypothetical protein